MNVDESPKLLKSFVPGTRLNEDSYVFISYSWKNKDKVDDFVSKISDYLYCWRDIHNLNGTAEIWDAIARAIIEASYVVAVITKDYEDSNSCRNELAFSMNMSKTVIPVLLDREYYPKSGVGIRIANLQYFLYEDIMKDPLPFIQHLYVMHTKHKNGPLKCLKIVNNRLKCEIDSIGHPKVLKPNKNIKDLNNNPSKCVSHIVPNELSHNLISNCVNINKNSEIVDTLSVKTDSLIAQPLPTKIYETDFNEIHEEMHSIESTYELCLYETVNSSVCCFMLLNVNELLVLSEDGLFHSMKRMNANTWSHLKAKLPISYNSNEEIYLKNYSTCKTIDACIDSKGQIYVLSVSKSLSKETQFYIWIFQFDYKYNTMSFKGQFPFAQHENCKNHLKTSEYSTCSNFSRIYIDEINSLIILLDDNHERLIYFYRESGKRKKSLQAPGAKTPTSYYLHNDYTYLGCKSGIIAFKNNSINGGGDAIIHDTKTSIVDLTFDAKLKCIYFIDDYRFYRSRFNDTNTYNFRYKSIFTNRNKEKLFKRILVKNDAVYILVLNLKTNLTSIYIIDKKRVEKHVL